MRMAVLAVVGLVGCGEAVALRESPAPVRAPPLLRGAVAGATIATRTGPIELTNWVDLDCLARVTAAIEDTHDQARFAAFVVLGCLRLPVNVRCRQDRRVPDVACMTIAVSRFVPLGETELCDVRELCARTVESCREPPHSVASRVDLDCIAGLRDLETDTPTALEVARWAKDCRTAPVDDVQCVVVGSQHDPACVAALHAIAEHPRFTMDAVWLDEACRVLDARCP